MAYTKVGIANLALIKIGVDQITSFSDGSVQANEIDDVYDFARDETLESSDWRFAKVRVALVKNSTAPASRYDFAYTLPSDFMKIFQEKAGDPALLAATPWPFVSWDGYIYSKGYRYFYVIETLDDGTECIFTNYDNDVDDLFLTYIRRVDDPTKYTARFINAFAWKIAIELVTRRTESKVGADIAQTRHEQALKGAKELDQSMDFLRNETGDFSWQGAGRSGVYI
jgi:hypothetical protein